MGMTTVKKVNAELQKQGLLEKLVKGKGYYYFTGGTSHTWKTSGVYVSSVNQMTLSEWVEERNHLASV